MVYFFLLQQQIFFHANIFLLSDGGDMPMSWQKWAFLYRFAFVFAVAFPSISFFLLRSL